MHLSHSHSVTLQTILLLFYRFFVHLFPIAIFPGNRNHEKSTCTIRQSKNNTPTHGCKFENKHVSTNSIYSGCRKIGTPENEIFVIFGYHCCNYNNISYELGDYQVYPNGDISPSIRYENVRCGVSHDFNRFGFKIPFGYPYMGYSKDDLQVMAVKQFNHTLFANRPVIKVKVLAFHAIQDYRIPVGLKIKTTELAVRRTEIASIATILEGDVNRFRVLSGRNAENWWQHRLVQNAKELITEGSPSAEKSCLMLRTFGNKIIRFNNTLKRMRTEKNCELIESWMSVKREVGSELWFALRFKNCSENVLEMMQTRMEVISIDERCVRILGEKGTQVEVCVDKTSHVRWGVRVKIIEN